MSEPKHTPDKLEIMEGFGQAGHIDTRYYIGSPELPQAVFVTSGGNDKAHAERLVLVWNGHDELERENKRYKKAINRAITILPLAKTSYVISELLQALQESKDG